MEGLEKRMKHRPSQMSGGQDKAVRGGQGNSGQATGDSGR